LDSNTRSIILTILIALLFLTVSFTISRYLLKRAMLTIVKIFRDHRALDDESARTRIELGLVSQGVFPFTLLDYKPTAFQVLLRSGIIRISQDAKRFFLSEQLLSQTDLEKKRNN
jgi:hypothetical protein